MHDIFLLAKRSDNCAELIERFPHIKVIYTETYELDHVIMDQILERTMTRFFYVVNDPHIYVNPEFNFDYVVPNSDKHYVTIWNKSTMVRLFNRMDVKRNEDYIDYLDKSNTCPYKNLDKIIAVDQPLYDVVFLSYDEPSATENFEALLKKCPRAKRVHGMKGIGNAHMAAAELARTPMVYIVDADAQVVDDFEFDYAALKYERDHTFVWSSINPVNGLQYGYGGVKLFNTLKLRNMQTWFLDFTTSTDNFHKMFQVSNVTAFNTDELATYRSAFRECVKLASNQIDGCVTAESEERLETWTTVGEDAPYGKYAIAGANDGMWYGMDNASDPDALHKINDYEWLLSRYEERYGPHKL